MENVLEHAEVASEPQDIHKPTLETVRLNGFVLCFVVLRVVDAKGRRDTALESSTEGNVEKSRWMQEGSRRRVAGVDTPHNTQGRHVG